MNHLLLYTRPGFEKECAAEIQDQATAIGLPGFCRAEPDSGYVTFTPYEPGTARVLAQRLGFGELIFARQMIAAADPLADLPPNDRITPLLAAVDNVFEPFSSVLVETADTDQAKPLLVFCRKFSRPLAQALRRAGRIDESDDRLWRLHVFFTASNAAWVGLSQPGNSSPWFMGIARLKLARDAPSRSALKLEEAFHVFLTAKEREERLRPGLRAVDLGAAPGGWTWQLVRRHLRVIAVDNGPMNHSLLESGLVEHRREDGFRYRPRKPVDWLVCDVVDQPVRIARLVAHWLAEGLCREAVFNLKLPMKKRYQEVLRCRAVMAGVLDAAGVPYRLALKQLYHDREEVTGHLRRHSPA